MIKPWSLSWRWYLEVGLNAEALGEAGVGRHADVAAAEDVAASQVLAFIKEEVAEGVREPAVNLVSTGGRQRPHDSVNKPITIALVCWLLTRFLEEEPLQQGEFADKTKRRSKVWQCPVRHWKQWK